MRYVLPIVVLLLVVAGLGFVKYKQIASLMAMGKAMEKAGAPPETVSTSRAAEQSWEGTLSAVGSIVADRGVAVSNDAPGIISRIAFESGAKVAAGQVLVELDTSVERAQLASAQARKDLALTNVTRTRALVAGGAVAQAQLDADESQLKTATTDLEALRAQIDRKSAKAPFAGRIGLRAVNLGQYLPPGTTIALLEAIDSVNVDFTMPQERLGDVKPGVPVRVSIGVDGGAPYQGTIAAIEPTVDPTTRSIKVRAAVPNKEEKLRPGMFVQVAVVLPQRGARVVVPATALVHATYGDSVFVVEPPKEGAAAPTGPASKVARQQFVRPGESRGDFVAILDGVKAGDEVVSSGAFKLRNGARVTIVPDVKPAPELAPHPENR